MVLWHSKRPFTCATASQLHLDIVVCTIPYATGKMQRRKTCLFHTIKTKHKKTPAELQGVQRSAKHKFQAIHLATSRNECKFLCERAIVSHYYDTTRWYTNYCPLQSAKVHFTSPQGHFLHIFSPLKCALAVRGPAYRFLFNQWSKTPQSTFKKQPTKTKKNKLQLVQ